MPMTVKVGLAKKVGRPDFGSLGASCDIELELDGNLLFHDLDGLQERISAAYVACRQAVNDELASQTRTSEAPSHDSSTNGHRQSPPQETPRRAVESGPHQANGGNGHTTNGYPSNGKRRAATVSQVRALHAIATRQGFNLTDRLRESFNLYRAEDLSISEASRLIDDLNAAAAPGANGSGGPV